MPKKIRELKSLLRKAGFTYKPAKGSHSKWKHPKLSKAIIIAGKEGDDAKAYLEKQVNESLELLKEVEEEEKQETEE
ncbi:MAG: type II toxin-antitoxin system HicA family toxin [Cyanobacteriota bacterium]|nr:type II toxin-antitoxin system HicA family toxin [Cyanobacteriota bacterium]